MSNHSTWLRVKSPAMAPLSAGIKSAVLLIGFNRPLLSAKVFEQIRKARPPRLFLAVDGPRQDHPTDITACNSVAKLAAEVDWPCDVKLQIQPVNLGCKRGVLSAINWFFEHEESGIILEDDCLPSQSFFRFCEIMLSAYRYEPTIAMISGSNFAANAVPPNLSYLISRYFLIWGWATWRRVWHQYDEHMQEWSRLRQSDHLRQYYGHSRLCSNLRKLFDQAYAGKLDTWDCQLALGCIIRKNLSILPPVNLISNIGTIGVHTGKATALHNHQTFELPDDYIFQPRRIIADDHFDRNLFNALFPPSRFDRALSYLGFCKL